MDKNLRLAFFGHPVLHAANSAMPIKGVRRGGVEGFVRTPLWGTTKINSHEFCMVLSGLLFLQFSPKHIKWSQFGHSSKRIFSKKLSASGGLRPLTPH